MAEHQLEPIPSMYELGWAWFSPDDDVDSIATYQRKRKTRSERFLLPKRAFRDECPKQRLLRLDSPEGVTIARDVGRFRTTHDLLGVVRRVLLSKADTLRFVFPNERGTLTLRSAVSMSYVCAWLRDQPAMVLKVQTPRKPFWKRGLECMKNLHAANYDGWIFLSYTVFEVSLDADGTVVLVASPGEVLFDVTRAAFAKFRQWVADRTGIVLGSGRGDPS